MNEGEREILRILNDPRLVTGEKADLVAQSLLGRGRTPRGRGWRISSAPRAEL